MNAPSRLPRTLKLLVALTLWWTLSAVVQAIDLVQMSVAAGAVADLEHFLKASLARNLTWIPICWLIVWLVERHTLEAGRYLASLAVLSAAGIAVALAKAYYMAVTNQYFGWFRELPTLSELFFISLRNHFLLYWLCVGAAHALVYFERAQKQKLNNAQLQTSLAQARLDALAAQINPHFLFNALNSIAELVHHDAEAAERMLLALSALLRQSLGKSGNQEVALREEIELLNQYLGIEQLRLGPRLRLRWLIDPATLELRVPPLLLQPLVENAIIHAIARRRRPGQVIIATRCIEGALNISIEDDGADGADHIQGNGIGLANARARLACLYGDDYSLELLPLDGGGTQVLLRLPRREVVPADAQPA